MLQTLCQRFGHQTSMWIFSAVISESTDQLWVHLTFCSTNLVFKLVGVLVLLLVEVDEVVCDPLSASAVHVPADLERITGDVTDPDLLGNRQVVHVPDAAVCRLCAWRRVSLHEHAGGYSFTPTCVHVYCAVTLTQLHFTFYYKYYRKKETDVQ